MDDNVRFISTIIAIIIFLSLSWFYRSRFNKEKMKSKDNGPKIGFFIVVFSILLAFWLM